jgi:hypothetical protein
MNFIEKIVPVLQDKPAGAEFVPEKGGRGAMEPLPNFTRYYTGKACNYLATPMTVHERPQRRSGAFLVSQWVHTNKATAWLAPGAVGNLIATCFKN